MSLIQSLGLGNVEADPNALPDGKWPGVILKSELVHSEKKNTVSHVITYQVTDGERKGATRQEWFTLVKDPIFDDKGNPVSGTPVMSEQQKPWYKKRLLDLGVPEGIVDRGEFQPEMLVGRKVTFGTKKNGEFINISFVEVREDTFTEGAPIGGPGFNAVNPGPAAAGGTLSSMI